MKAASLDSQQGNISWVGIFIDFQQPLYWTTWTVCRLNYCHFLLDPFQFITHESTYRLCNLDTEGIVKHVTCCLPRLPWTFYMLNLTTYMSEHCFTNASWGIKHILIKISFVSEAAVVRCCLETKTLLLKPAQVKLTFTVTESKSRCFVKIMLFRVMLVYSARKWLSLELDSL